MTLPNGYPSTQRAVQLTGPDALVLNGRKPVPAPGPHQFLARVEVTGLCFSDLKLLKQFDGHARKSPVVDGLDEETLDAIPGYVPGTRPTVPGHETVVRIVAVGDRVRSVKPGDRRLVQPDYRWLRTIASNAAFGYNFEGALQEYVLMDERVVTAPDGASTLIPAPEDLSASSIALAEPWACVENAYLNPERGAPLEAGRSLRIDCAARERPSLGAVADESLDDILFLGADADLLEQAFPKLASGGLVNIVQNGQSFGRPVRTPVGRIHYGGLRITGTTGSDPAEGYRHIPRNGEIRDGEAIHVVGAGGPMGTMHVIRNLCQGVPSISVTGSDLNDTRLAQLVRLAGPVAERGEHAFQACHAAAVPAAWRFSYIVIMVPLPSLAAEALASACEGAIINLFAGIPVQVVHPLDLDTYLGKKVYFTGTSGSTTRDMKVVLDKVANRRLETDLSVSAVCGLDGAVAGIRAVEQQTLPGKILVYPSCHGLELTPLPELPLKFPEVAAQLREGVWTLAAEQALLQAHRVGPATP